MTDKPIIASPGWIPPAGVTDITGKPLGQDGDFFVQPPKMIGRIVAVRSDVRVGQTLWPMPMKLGLGGALLAIGVGVIAWLKNQSVAGAKPGMGQVVVFMLCLCVPAICIAYAFKKRYLAFVGEQGAAVYFTRGRRDDTSGQVVRFADVADVQVVEKHFRKGWIEMKMHFVDGSGNRLMTLNGKTKEFGGRTIPMSDYVIASAIHAAWKKR